MHKSPLVAGLLAVTALSGCFGSGGDNDPTTSTGPGATNGPDCCANISLTLTILNYTTAANTSEPINVTWEVSVDGDVNSTDLNVEHTDIHWGNASMSEPTNTSDYPSTTEAQSGPPGVFNATFTIATNGSFYARAHAVLNGSDHWSDEVVIQVNPGVPPIGETHEISIGALTVGLLATYDPDDLTIKVGDAVKWVNDDRVAPHTATSDDGAPQAFDTGNIATGGESAVIQFTVAGTYEYHCEVHDTMSATLTVE